ncbi:S24 family peptidase [Hydrocarboniphaga sp.]|uniref:S24 family peptidase n=1 Tax=Hydrocarboniphaga sp. TaxID=2033016 RepID=UPI003D0D8BB5
MLADIKAIGGALWVAESWLMTGSLTPISGGAYRVENDVLLVEDYPTNHLKSALISPWAGSGDSVVSGAEDVDEPGQYEGELSVGEQRALSSGKQLRGDVLLLPQISAQASMGYGAAIQEHIDVVRLMRVSWAELRRQVRGPISSPENLRILTAYGTSMRPTFNDGDPLLVDIGVDLIDREGVYVLERGQELYVKRMQRMITDGSLLMISDNKEEHPYPEKIPREAMGRDFFVRGRVLLVWNAKNL